MVLKAAHLGLAASAPIVELQELEHVKRVRCVDPKRMMNSLPDSSSGSSDCVRGAGDEKNESFGVMPSMHHSLLGTCGLGTYRYLRVRTSTGKVHINPIK